MIDPSLPFAPATEPYVSLATYRRNGRAVLTPVWIAPCNDRFYLFSASKAGKVKRIRANPAVRLASCGSTGKITSEWIEAEAHVLTDAHLIGAARLALREKYRWQMIITDSISKLFGRYEKRAYIEIRIRDTTTDLPNVALE